MLSTDVVIWIDIEKLVQQRYIPKCKLQNQTHKHAKQRVHNRQVIVISSIYKITLLAPNI